MSRSEIVEGVRECLAKVADLDGSAVRETDKVIGDLGLDSLDLLDLVFQLERRFAIRISPRDIERRAQVELGSRPLEVGGVYTADAIEQLKRYFPEEYHGDLPGGLRTADLPRVFRVSTFVDLVARLREEQHGK